MNECETLKPSEAAKILGVHPVTIRGLIRQKAFKVINIGRKRPTYLIVRDSFDRYRQAK